MLVVDDEPYICEVVCRWLEADGHTCFVSHDGLDALEQTSRRGFDLVVSDINMPRMSGLELLAELQTRQPEVAVMMATGVADRGTAIAAVKRGAYGYLIKPLQEDEVVIGVANALERRRLKLLDRRYQEHLEDELERRTLEVARSREEIALMLVSASEFRDIETGAHVRRMGLYAESFATALGWGREAAEQIRLAAPMHDIGKIGVPDRILLKPGRLTDDEFRIAQQHAEIGAELLSGSDLTLLRLARDIAGGHHERWDGSGYPRQLAGSAIPRPARLVAIADVYDALTHDRVYRPAMSEQEAVEIIVAGRGSQFDPEMCDAFVAHLPEIRKIRESISLGQ